jgi:hypothetical protein
MARFEKELSEALRREPAPEWLEGRILAQIREEKLRGVKQRGRQGAPLRWHWMRWAGALATLALVFAGVHFEQVRRERIEGEQAKEKLLIALHITGSKLRMTQQRILSMEGPDAAQ